MTQPPNSDVEKVAACWRCGSNAHLEPMEGYPGWWHVQCDDEKGCNAYGNFAGKAEAIAWWNKRAALQPSGGDAVAAEREACAKIVEAQQARRFCQPVPLAGEHARADIAAAIRARTPTPQEPK